MFSNRPKANVILPPSFHASKQDRNTYRFVDACDESALDFLIQIQSAPMGIGIERTKQRIVSFLFFFFFMSCKYSIFERKKVDVLTKLLE